MNLRLIVVAFILFAFFNVYSQDIKAPLTKLLMKDSYVRIDGVLQRQTYDAYLHELGDSSISFSPKPEHDMNNGPIKKSVIIPVENINKIEYRHKPNTKELASGLLLGGVIGAGSGLIIGTISGYREGADPGELEIHILTEGENYIPRSRRYKMITRGMGYGLIGSMIGGLSGFIIKSLTNKSTIMIDGNQQKYEKNKLELSKRVVVF